MADYTMWYRVGEVAVTKNSKIITGTGTYWLSASIKPGDLFSIDSVTEYEVQSVDSNTQITLKTVFTGDSVSESAYRIIRNFTSTPGAQVAAETAELLNNFRRYVDTDMQSIHGKSAYQIACDRGYVGTESEWLESLHAPDGKSAYEVACENGFEGTESEWLESLIGAGQWNVLDERTTPLTWNTAAIRNSIARGQNLGEFTATHLAEIKAGRFRGMWLGDWFTVNGRKCYIAGFNYITGFIAAHKYSITLLGALPFQPLTNSDAPNAFYGESYWYTECRPTYIAEYEEAFGAENIPAFKVCSPIGYSSYTADGAPYYEPNAFVELSSKVHLPTYSMCVGHAISPYHHFRPYLAWNYSYPNNNYYPQLPIYRAGLGRTYLLYSVLSDVGETVSHICVTSQYSVMHEPKTGAQKKFAVFHVQA